MRTLYPLCTYSRREVPCSIYTGSVPLCTLSSCVHHYTQSLMFTKPRKVSRENTEQSYIFKKNRLFCFCVCDIFLASCITPVLYLAGKIFQVHCFVSLSLSLPSRANERSLHMYYLTQLLGSQIGIVIAPNLSSHLAEKYSFFVRDIILKTFIGLNQNGLSLPFLVKLGLISACD